MVLKHAAVKDSSNIMESNPRTRKSLNVNMTELVFDNGQVAYEPCEMEVNGHRTSDTNMTWDIDTPLSSIEAHQTETESATNPPFTRPQRVWMDDNTWGKMSSPDRRAWLSISEPSKKNILNYGSERKENPAGGFKPSGFKPNTRRANAHEIDEQDQEEPPVKREARTHDHSLSFARQPRQPVKQPTLKK